MKKKTIISIIVSIITVAVLAIVFLGNINKNPLIGFWQEVNSNNSNIRILEFNENSYLTEINLNYKGDKSTDSYTYSFSQRSETVVIITNSGNDIYGYDVKNDLLTLSDDDGFTSTWKKIPSINFLEKEQEKRIKEEAERQEELRQQREEEERRKEEEKRRKEEERIKLSAEYDAYRKNPSRSAELKLVGKWEQWSNYNSKDTYEFFEDGRFIHYYALDNKTVSGTYHVYPNDLSLSYEELLQFKNGNYEPKTYSLHLIYENTLIHKLLFKEDYIKIRDISSYYDGGEGRRFDKIS